MYYVSSGDDDDSSDSSEDPTTSEDREDVNDRSEAETVLSDADKKLGKSKSAVSKPTPRPPLSMELIKSFFGSYLLPDPKLPPPGSSRSKSGTIVASARKSLRSSVVKSRIPRSTDEPVCDGTDSQLAGSVDHVTKVSPPRGVDPVPPGTLFVLDAGQKKKVPLDNGDGSHSSPTATGEDDDVAIHTDSPDSSAAKASRHGKPGRDVLTKQPSEFQLSSALDPGINEKDYIYFDVDPYDVDFHLGADQAGPSSEVIVESKLLKSLANPGDRLVDLKTTHLEELMKKSVITDDFARLPCVPQVSNSKRKLKRLRKAERELTKGGGWFGLPATELSEERRRDLELLKMRDVLDPKKHYKSNDTDVIPKYFEVGTVVEHSSDFYSSRVPKKERKKTLVDELLADAEAQKYQKRRYGEIMAEDARRRKGAFRKRKAAGKRKPPKRERKLGS